MSSDSLVNAGEYLSAHYLAEVFPKDLRRVVLPAWAEQEKAGGPSPRTRRHGGRTWTSCTMRCCTRSATRPPAGR